LIHHPPVLHHTLSRNDKPFLRQAATYRIFDCK
jgi:hypothetical protein